MAIQTEFVQRNDGHWYAPPMDPLDDLDFTVDFGPLIGTGDTIAQVSNITVDHAQLQNSSDDGRMVTVWIAGQVARTVVTVTILIVTTGGRSFNRSFKVEVFKQ